jgi:hypothetical protein
MHLKSVLAISVSAEVTLSQVRMWSVVSPANVANFINFGTTNQSKGVWSCDRRVSRRVGQFLGIPECTCGFARSIPTTNHISELNEG